MSTVRTRTGRSAVRRTAVATATLLLGAVALAGCSDEGNGQDSVEVVADQQSDDFQADRQEQARIRQAYNDLPEPTAGIVTVDGNEGSLTPGAATSYNGTGTTDDVQVAFGGEDRAFQQLCAGQIDLVDSSREISRAELDACEAVGLDVVQFQIASDAVVLAIESETDVGGDCLFTDQVQEMYRAGSPIVNWSQIEWPLGGGFDDIPLEVAGPDIDSNAFGFFGRYVLDSPEPSLVDFRGDYHHFETDDGTRLFVTGDKADESLALRLNERSKLRDQYKSQLEAQWQVVRDAEEAVRDAQFEVRKGIRDDRPPADRARDRRRLQAAQAKLDRVQARARELYQRQKRIGALYADAVGARDRMLATRGHLGYFRFSYYELFEDQLRPFEVSEPDGDLNCIFPSQRTITSGEYPFARRLLITTTTRSLERDEVKGFLRYYLQTAQERATDARLVALPENIVTTELAWVNGTERPTLVTVEDETTTTTASPSPTPGEQPAQ